MRMLGDPLLLTFQGLDEGSNHQIKVLSSELIYHAFRVSIIGFKIFLENSFIHFHSHAIRDGKFIEMGNGDF
jgi:hypothetical protein